MELKPYQKTVIDDLASYIQALQETQNIAEAFKKHWDKKSVKTGVLPGQMQPYKNNVPKVPHICLKVPTAGGKTFIACNALREIFSIAPMGKPKAVVWLVPSSTILEQTLKNLRNIDHPYRQKINTHFNGRVEIYDKNQLLQGANFNATSVKEQLSIFVLSFDSFRAKNKETRKMYEENGNLANFPAEYLEKENLLPNVDETALIQVINQLSPVCVLDESHNAETELSVEMLQNLNPSFILDLTATPRKNSNIISFIDAFQLKKENMVKLPVIVYNCQTKNQVVEDALQLQKNLEHKAKEEEKISGKYIRPMVLFQAEPKNAHDTATFESVKKTLMELNIPENHIAIKTATINEIKNIDLLSPECEIRFIITINALKEGWDCPFAYILASLANKSSSVDVEQILGRILRQPYVCKHSNDLLNLSYVFTASEKFHETLENIVKGLQKSGFSKDDYRVLENQNEAIILEKQIIANDLFGSTPLENNDDELNVSKIALPAENFSHTIMQIEEKAKEEHNRFVQEMQNTDDIFSEIPSVLREYMTQNSIQEKYKTIAESIKIPQFVFKKNELSFFENTNALLEKENILENFRLEQADTNISFEETENVWKVDIEENQESPKYTKTKPQTTKYLLDYILKLPEEKQIKNITEIIFKIMGKTSNALSDSDVGKYIERIIGSFQSSEFQDCIENPNKYARKIKEKIENLTEQYASKVFYQYLDSDYITTKPLYSFSKTIFAPSNPASLAKSLYQQEGDINGFEWRVISEISNLENVEFWNRNIDRKGFCINGFFHHYPDFMVHTKKGKTIILETKGDDRDNSDSEKKLKLGKAWAEKAGENFKYFMVFDKNPIAEAYTFEQFLEIIKTL